jgi:hypothetical protein
MRGLPDCTMNLPVRPATSRARARPEPAWPLGSAAARAHIKKLGIAAVAIGLGSVIYLLWRSDSLTLFVWLDRLGLESQVVGIRHSASWLSAYMPGYVLYSVPNALWFFAGMLVFDSIWGARSNGKILWISIFSTVAVGCEVAQGLRLIPGTFDWADLALMALGGCLVLVISAHFRRRKGEVNHDSSGIVQTRALTACSRLPGRHGSRKW